MPVNYNKTNKKIASLQEQLANSKKECYELREENAVVKGALHGTLHEVRRFSAEISSNAELLNRELENINNNSLQDLAKTILFTSGLVSSRLAFTDLELNPRAITQQSYIKSGVYKKFEKASHILKQRAISKSLQISFSNKSFMEIETLPSFELIPFCLLENAIKYSPYNQVIEVRFEEVENKASVKVLINSIGPIMPDIEIAKIFDRGFRGQNAEKLSVGGEGLGLFLVKFLCDIHSIDIKITSEQTTSFALQGIPYSKFSVELDFTR